MLTLIIAAAVLVTTVEASDDHTGGDLHEDDSAHDADGHYGDDGHHDDGHAEGHGGHHKHGYVLIESMFEAILLGVITGMLLERFDTSVPYTVVLFMEVRPAAKALREAPARADGA